MRIEPPLQLQPYVQSYIILEWDKDRPGVTLPAWTSNFLFFKYGDNSDVVLQNGKYLKGYDTMVTGCMTYALRFVKESIAARMIAVEFKPLTLYSYLGRDVSYLTDNSFYGDELFPGASTVMAKIKQADEPEDRLESINRFLLEIFKNVQYEENPMITEFFENFDASIIESSNLSIQFLAEKYGISQKQYRRIFLKLTGITPKLYYRIKRLEYILQELHNQPDQKYLNVLRGYVDQSHFIKDFIRFTGQRPTELQNLFRDVKLTKIYNYL